MCAEIMAKHSGNPLPKIVEDSERDFYMNPKQAVEYGLIDKVMEPKEK